MRRDFVIWRLEKAIEKSYLAPRGRPRGVPLSIENEASEGTEYHVQISPQQIPMKKIFAA